MVIVGLCPVSCDSWTQTGPIEALLREWARLVRRRHQTDSAGEVRTSRVTHTQPLKRSSTRGDKDTHSAPCQTAKQKEGRKTGQGLTSSGTDLGPDRVWN